MTINETYLGDGLYASFDGFMVKLRAPRQDGDHYVWLEPPVLDAFIDFLANTVTPTLFPPEPDGDRQS